MNRPLCFLRGTGALVMQCDIPIGRLVVLHPGDHPTWSRGTVLALGPRVHLLDVYPSVYVSRVFLSNGRDPLMPCGRGARWFNLETAFMHGAKWRNMPEFGEWVEWSIDQSAKTP